MPLKDSSGNIVTIKKQGETQKSILSDFAPTSATIGNTSQSILFKPKISSEEAEAKRLDLAGKKLEIAKKQKELSKTNEGKPMPAKALEDVDNLINTIDNMQSLEDELKAKKYPIGVHMKVVPWEALQYANPEMTSWLAGVDTHFHKNIRKPITGAQAATNELNMLRPLAPSASDSPENFMLKSERTRKGSVRALKVALNSYKRAGYDVSGLEPLVKQYEGQVTTEAKTKKAVPATTQKPKSDPLGVF